MAGNLKGAVLFIINSVLIFLLLLVLYRLVLTISISSQDKCDSRFCTAIIDKTSPCYSETPGVPTCMAVPGFNYYPSLIAVIALLGASLPTGYLLVKKTSIRATLIVFTILSIAVIGQILFGMKLF